MLRQTQAAGFKGIGIAGGEADHVPAIARREIGDHVARDAGGDVVSGQIAVGVATQPAN